MSNPTATTRDRRAAAEDGDLAPLGRPSGGAGRRLHAARRHQHRQHRHPVGPARPRRHLQPDPAGARRVASTAEVARKRNFSDAFERTLLFEVAVFLLCLLLTFLLPDPRGRAPGRAPAEVAAGA
jgi:hypothetical protein